MKEKIAKETFAKWQDLNNQAGALEGGIIDRVDYIIHKIFAVFNNELDWWDFPGDGDRCEGGRLSDAIRHDDDIFCFTAETREYLKEKVILLKDGSEWGFDNEFPTRWLFEDFEEELIEGKKKFEEVKIERAKQALLKKKTKKEKDKILVEQAKAKLSKEELAALKKNL